MAEEEQAQEAQAPEEKKGGGGMLPALLVILLMPAISYGMFQYMFIPTLEKKFPDMGNMAEVVPDLDDIKHVKAESGAMDHSYDVENIVTNLKGTTLTKYLRVSMAIYSSHEDFEASASANDKRLRALAINNLDTLTLEDIERHNTKTVLASQIKQDFNRVLEDMVEEVIFYDFAVQ